MSLGSSSVFPIENGVSRLQQRKETVDILSWHFINQHKKSAWLDTYLAHEESASRVVFSLQFIRISFCCEDFLSDLSCILVNRIIADIYPNRSVCAYKARWRTGSKWLRFYWSVRHLLKTFQGPQKTLECASSNNDKHRRYSHPLSGSSEGFLGERDRQRDRKEQKNFS